jgi:hypothetical protein
MTTAIDVDQTVDEKDVALIPFMRLVLSEARLRMRITQRGTPATDVRNRAKTADLNWDASRLRVSYTRHVYNFASPMNDEVISRREVESTRSTGWGSKL